ESTVKRVIRKLKDAGILLVNQLKAYRWWQINWYSLDHEKLELLILSIRSTCADRSGQAEPIKTEDYSAKITHKQTDDRVFSDRQEKADQGAGKPIKKEKAASDPEIDWQVYNHLLGELDGTGIPKTKQIEQYLKEALRKWGAAAAARVQHAIAAFKQAKNIQNPGGWLVTAIERGFKPNQPRSQSEDTSPEPLPAEPGRSPLPPSSPTIPGFRAWFDKAKLLGLVTASANDGAGVKLFLPDESAIAWESFARHYPLEKLDEIAHWLRVASSKLGATRARIEGGVVMIDFLGESSVTWEAAQRTYRDLL
ncbi:MAG: hypothetical protein SFW36_10630, partial [Leptolyngbyaceae cyanobacterium bins.59]|nr:hypothetical protein [Leptolyngbyaceae cyanobacterium bins.59]